MQFKTTRNKVGLFSAVLAVVALGTSCGSPLGNKVNPKDANSRQQLMDTLKVYEDSQSSVVMDKTSMSLTVNNFSAKGKGAIYKQTGTDGSGIYKRKVIDNIGFSIDNQKTVSTTIPNYLLRDLNVAETRSSDKATQKGLEYDVENVPSGGVTGKVVGINSSIQKYVSIPEVYRVLYEDNTYELPITILNFKAFESSTIKDLAFETLDLSESKIDTINGVVNYNEVSLKASFKNILFENKQIWTLDTNHKFTPLNASGTELSSDPCQYFYCKNGAIYCAEKNEIRSDKDIKLVKKGTDSGITPGSYEDFVQHLQYYGCKVNSSSSNDDTSKGFEKSSSVNVYSLSYLLSFPLVSILPDVLYGDKIFGDYYQNMETNFYLQNAKNDAKNVNFTLSATSLIKFADEIATKFGASIAEMLPVQGDGSFYVTCKTDENGYLSYINFQLKGKDIKVAMGQGLHDKEPLTSSVAKNAKNEDESGDGSSAFDVLKTLLTYYFGGYMNGGVKFEGEANIDITLDLSREASTYRTANFITDDYSNEKYSLVPQKLSQGFEVPSFDELIAGKFAVENKTIRAENPSYLFDGQNYECLIVPKEVSYQSGVYYEIDPAKCGISVNGIKVNNQTASSSMDYNYHYMTEVDYAITKPGQTMPKTIKAYKICIGRNYINKIKSTLGDDALFQFKFGIKE